MLRAASIEARSAWTVLTWCGSVQILFKTASNRDPAETGVVLILQFLKADSRTVRTAKLDCNLDQTLEDALWSFRKYLGETSQSNGLAIGITRNCLTCHKLRIFEKITEAHSGFSVLGGRKHVRAPPQFSKGYHFSSCPEAQEDPLGEGDRCGQYTGSCCGAAPWRNEYAEEDLTGQ